MVVGRVLIFAAADGAVACVRAVGSAYDDCLVAVAQALGVCAVVSLGAVVFAAGPWVVGALIGVESVAAGLIFDVCLIVP